MPEFQDGQIIYLQHQEMRLYAETIQVIPARQLCWARPLALLQQPDAFFEFHPKDDFQDFDSDPIFYDLRQGSDLLLPTSLFCVALDVDAIPVLTQLNAPKTSLPDASGQKKTLAHTALQNFVRQVWQAYPNRFTSRTTG
jgi:hypothetical protein